MTRWPSFSGLRAFEAVARHGALAEAGRSLSITPSGVSHRIRDLEMFLQVTLFHREGRRYRLTLEGELLYKKVSRSMDMLSSAMSDIADHHAASKLRIRTPGAFGQFFLSPRLHAFIRRNRNIEIFLGSYTRLSDHDEDEVDITIRRKTAPAIPETETIMMEEDLVPVCRPDYAREISALVPTDPRIRFVGVSSDAERETYYADWTAFFVSAGLGSPRIQCECNFNQLAPSLCFVKANGGVVLANREYVIRDLRTGALEQPWDLNWKTGVVLAAAVNRAARDKLAVRKFMTWLTQEAGLAAGDAASGIGKPAV